MRNINKGLKIFSILMLFILVFSVAAFAEPDEDETNVSPVPSTEQIVTEPASNATEPTASVTSAKPTTTTKAIVTQKPKTTVTSVQRPTATVQTTAPKSSNANLSSLIIKGYTSDGQSVELELSPSFKSEIKSYKIDAPEGVVTVQAEAKAESSGASITIPSDIKLVEGNNIIKIVVTAEDESTRTYEINIVVEKQEETTELTTQTTTEIQTVPAVSTNNKKGLNTYTKLGIVFAIGGAALLGISIYLFFRKKK